MNITLVARSNVRDKIDEELIMMFITYQLG